MLKLEFGNFVTHQRKPTHFQVAGTYFGTRNDSRTKHFLASMAVCVKIEMLHALVEIMNTQDPGICLNNDLTDSSNATNTKQVIETVECRVFRSFFTSHCIRMFPSFMNPENDLEDLAHSNKWSGRSCTYQHSILWKRLLPFNQLKPMQYPVINKQYQLAVHALSKEQKVLDYPLS